MSGALLLTGGTGFLGMELIARQLDAGDGPDIFLAVRAGDDAGTQARIDELLGRLYDEVPASAGRLRPLRADLTAPMLGMTGADRALVASEVTHVIHCAASISFTLPLEVAREINVNGTRRLLALGAELPRLERFVHVSTAYVSGRAPARFTELDAGGADFRNTYEQTKHEAELAVTGSELPSVIVRPSIVVGERDSGWTSAFNVLYWPLQAFARGLLTEVPADPYGLVDMVPVDYVAHVIEHAAFTAGVSGRLHAVAGERALRVAELIDAVCSELDRDPPVMTAPGPLAADDPAAIFAPYFDVATRFDNRRAAALAGPAPEPLSYLPQLLDYGRAARWGKRPRTRASVMRSGGPSRSEERSPAAVPGRC